MNNFLASSLIAFAMTGLSVTGTAQTVTAGHENHAATHASGAIKSPLTEGLVKKIDKSTARVTLAHGPLPDGMPAMTMAYHVKEATWLDKMKPGQKILFAAESVSGVMTLVRFELPK